MKVGILGSGDVGQALGRGFADKGHEVMIGSREPQSDKLLTWLKNVGGKGKTGTFKETADFGEVLVIATKGLAAVEAITQAGEEQFSGKVVIDATNPLDMSTMPPKLVHENGVSGGEQIQAAIPDAKVVKCFNIIGNPSMVDPAFEEGEPDMFLCGNDEGAKATVTQILKEFGWNLITDIGGIEMSRHLESMCIVWVAYGVKHNNWHIGFKMLRK